MVDFYTHANFKPVDYVFAVSLSTVDKWSFYLMLQQHFRLPEKFVLRRYKIHQMDSPAFLH